MIRHSKTNGLDSRTRRPNADAHVPAFVSASTSFGGDEQPFGFPWGIVRQCPGVIPERIDRMRAPMSQHWCARQAIAPEGWPLRPRIALIRRPSPQWDHARRGFAPASLAFERECRAMQDADDVHARGTARGRGGAACTRRSARGCCRPPPRGRRSPRTTMLGGRRCPGGVPLVAMLYIHSTTLGYGRDWAIQPGPFDHFAAYLGPRGRRGAAARPRGGRGTPFQCRGSRKLGRERNMETPTRNHVSSLQIPRREV